LAKVPSPVPCEALGGAAGLSAPFGADAEGPDGAAAGARLLGAAETCQLLRGDGDGIPEVGAVGALALPSDGTVTPSAAAQRRGISSTGGGPMGVPVHGSSASMTSWGV